MLVLIPWSFPSGSPTPSGVSKGVWCNSGSYNNSSMLRMHWTPKMCAGDPAIVSTCQTSRRRRHKRRIHWFHLKGKTFCLYSIGENLVVWTYPASRQAGKCSFKVNNYISSYSVPRQVARMWDQLEVSVANIFFSSLHLVSCIPTYAINHFIRLGVMSAENYCSYTNRKQGQ